MKYGLGDLNNGVFEEFETLEEAEAALQDEIEAGFNIEKEICDELSNNLSDEDILERCREFFFIKDLETEEEIYP